MKKTLILANVLLLACSWGASAQVLTGFQLNFNLGSPHTGYFGEGALGETIVPLSIGNGVPDPATDYSLADGVEVSFTAPGALNGTDDESAGYPGTIYQGYAFDPAANDVVTITFSGLTAGDTYDLAGYAGENSPVTFAASTSGTLTGANIDPSVYSLGANYTTFTGVADMYGDLTVTATPASDNIIRFSGIGIESVPEPSSLVLLGLGGFSLLAVLRHRRTTVV